MVGEFTDDRDACEEATGFSTGRAKSDEDSEVHGYNLVPVFRGVARTASGSVVRSVRMPSCIGLRLRTIDNHMFQFFFVLGGL